MAGLFVAFLRGRRDIALAGEANADTRETGQAQARAYVMIESVACRLSARGELVARVTFHNSGNSPARQLRWLYSARVDTFGDADDTRCSFALEDKPYLDRSHWRQDIASGASWTSTPLGVGGRDGTDIGAAIGDADSIEVTMKVVAEYQDVCGRLHSESACFQGRVVAADATYAELERAPDDVLGTQSGRGADSQRGGARALGADDGARGHGASLPALGGARPLESEKPWCTARSEMQRSVPIHPRQDRKRGRSRY